MTSAPIAHLDLHPTHSNTASITSQKSDYLAASITLQSLQGLGAIGQILAGYSCSRQNGLVCISYGCAYSKQCCVRQHAAGLALVGLCSLSRVNLSRVSRVRQDWILCNTRARLTCHCSWQQGTGIKHALALCSTVKQLTLSAQ